MKYHSMVWKDQFKFNTTQFDDIKLAIRLAKKIVDGGDLDYNGYYRSYSPNDFGDQQENVKIYAVSVLPFILAKFNITKLDIEQREHYKEILHFLQFIQNNKRMANYFIGTTTSNKYKDDYPSINFDDFYGFNEPKIKVAIELYKFYLSGKITQKKRWFSNVFQILFLAKTVDIAWDNKEKKKIDFIYKFFAEFGKEVEDETIKKQFIYKAREHPFISHSEFPGKILNPLTTLLI